MPDVMLNRVIFDFNCSTEAAAKLVSDEVVHYKAAAMNKILSEVFSSEMNPDSLWKIEKLEIDLGNLRFDDFAGEEFLRQFKVQLSKNIEASRHPRNQGSGANFSAVAPGADQLEILKQILLSGDLPWWVDKTSFAGTDRVVKQVIQEDPESLKSFLSGQKRNPDVAIRIKSLCSQETVLMMNSLVPGISDLFSTNLFESDGARPDLVKVAGLRIGRSDRESVRALMIERLLANPGKHFLPALRTLRFLSEHDAARIALLISVNHSGNSADVARILRKLSFFQLAYLSNQAGLETREAEPDIPVSPEDKARLVSYLAARIGVGNISFQNLSQNAPFRTLKELEKIFKGYAGERQFKGQWIELLIKDPVLFHNRVLNIMMGSSDEKGDGSTSGAIRSVKTTAADFRRSIAGLSEPETLILRQSFRSGSTDAAAGREIVAKILGRMPAKSLRVITALLTVDTTEMKKNPLRPSITETPGVSANIIVENAGICLLGPYLPAFFARLGFTRQGRFSSRAKAYRAAYLLEYLVHGRQRNFEYNMPFNKLLCGLRISEPLPAYKRLTLPERKEAEALLTSVIGNWEKLKSTGLAGFRDSFLRRKGILVQQENSWLLRVERRSYDLLLDSVPWTFNRIKFSWMEKMLQTDW